LEISIIKNKEPVELSKVKFIHSLNCNLRFELGLLDIGIDPSSENKFVILLTIEGYKNMVGYMNALVSEENNLAGYLMKPACL
jgi:hypothetical protein